MIPSTYEYLLNPAQNAFNRAHKRTRRIIENAFEILKEKFPYLNYLRVNSVFAGNIFKCFVTLCNKSKLNHPYVINLPLDDDDVPANSLLNPENEIPPAAGAQAKLQQFINHFRI